MQTLCANTSALNVYLADEAAADARTEWEAERADKLLKEMQPFTALAVLEAMTEASHVDGIKLAAALATGDNASIGGVMSAIVLAYWTAFTKKQAEDDYARIDCYKCLDKGCRKCDEDYDA